MADIDRLDLWHNRITSGFLGVLAGFVLAGYLLVSTLPDYSNPRHIPDCQVCANGCRTERDLVCSDFLKLVRSGDVWRPR